MNVFHRYRIVGARLQNIYDINSKTFLFKFNPKEGDEKLKVIIESGVRIHKTNYDFDSGNVQPSFFAMKLRKFLRDRRCTAFSQLGFDRLIYFEFGHPNPAMIYHLYVEFYSSGNIILTDSNRKVLQILRVVKSEVASISLEIGSYYKRIEDLITLQDHFIKLESLITDPITNVQLKKLIKEQFGVFSTAMLSHIMSQTSCSDGSKDFICQILDHFKLELISSIAEPKGYLTFEMQSEERMYCDFHSFKFAHLNPELIISFDSFNDALDEFYSKIEYQKTQKRIQQQESEAQSKIAAIGAEQQNRIKSLEKLIDLHLFRALAIESNINLVGDVILIIKAAIESGMDWSELEHLILEEKKKGRDTALVIEKLKLECNLVILSLEASDTRKISVDIDINLSPHANSTRYYDLRKAAIVKLDRSKEAFEKALKSAEKKIRADLKTAQTKVKRQQILSKRKTFWFEKFNWFISSDNFLVISGRDFQQNELLVKRYLKEGDIYVHADMHGAASVVIKNRRNEDKRLLSIPEKTLSEAGTMSLCHSRAWESKILTSAWWVYASQVSKTAPSGEYLSTGSFVIRGKKNFLPPSQLIYGFGFLFVVDDDAKERNKQRRIFHDKELSLSNAVDLDLDLSTNVEKYLDLIENDEQSEVILTNNHHSKKLTNTSKKMPKVEKQEKIEHIENKNGSKSSRGKKGKQKKISKKYSNQDDEEREIKMKLLASANSSSTSMPRIEIQAQNIKHMPDVKTFSPKQEQPKEDSYLDENEPVVEDNEFGALDSLVGSLKGNVKHILYAIPVSGPISALSQYSLRVKLVPGSLKRGKAVQQALSIICNQRDVEFSSADISEDQSTTEAYRKIKELLRGVPDSDLNQTMLGHVKIAATLKEIAKSKKEMANLKAKSKKGN